jgi:hypothetical protein
VKEEGCFFRSIGFTCLARCKTLNLVRFQKLSDFLVQFLEKFGVNFTIGWGLLGDSLPPMPPSGEALPVIFAKRLKVRTLLKKLPDSCHRLRKILQD